MLGSSVGDWPAMPSKSLKKRKSAGRVLYQVSSARWVRARVRGHCSCPQTQVTAQISLCVVRQSVVRQSVVHNYLMHDRVSCRSTTSGSRTWFLVFRCCARCYLEQARKCRIAVIFAHNILEKSFHNPDSI